MSKPSSKMDVEALRGELATRDAQLATRDAQLASLAKTLAGLEGKIAALESSLVNFADENELLKRRLFGPRSERTGTSELQLPLAGILSTAEAALRAQPLRL